MALAEVEVVPFWYVVLDASSTVTFTPADVDIVKLDVDTLPTVPDAPPEAGPDRALDPPPPDPAGWVVVEVEEMELEEEAAAVPQAAKIAVAASKRTDIFSDSSVRVAIFLRSFSSLLVTQSSAREACGIVTWFSKNPKSHPGRRPQYTTRNRLIMPANSFESAYLGTPPPWDIGRPQPAIVKLAETGQITGSVLDVGCGTGENVLYLAERGFAASGVDGAPTAIKKAQAKAKRRGLNASFEVGDALDLSVPKRPYDTVIDSGLFHVFSDQERTRFAESLRRVIRLGGVYFLMCFSDQQAGDWGPRRVTQAEIRSVFSDGWRVNQIQPSAFETNGGHAHAWLASISRL